MPEGHEPGSYLKATLESQPRELARLLADDSVAGAARRLRDCHRLFVIGTGTSYHGALAGQFMLRSAGIEAWAVRAFEFANYAPALHEDDGLVLLSHRGTKRFSVGALEAFAASSGRWVAVTGEGSPMDGEGIVRTVAQEESPVHTASHTGAMVRLAQLAVVLGKPAWQPQLAEVPAAVEQALGLGERVARDVAGLELRPVTHFVGGGPARATAYEGALKLREASHLVSAEGHDVEGVLHGPLISIQPGQAVFVVAQPGPSLDRAHDVVNGLVEIGASCIQVGAAAQDGYQTPELDEVLAPIVNVIPLQWLAYHAARKLGVDADSFRRDEPRYSAAQSRYAL